MGNRKKSGKGEYASRDERAKRDGERAKMNRNERKIEFVCVYQLSDCFPQTLFSFVWIINLGFIQSQTVSYNFGFLVSHFACEFAGWPLFVFVRLFVCSSVLRIFNHKVQIESFFLWFCEIQRTQRKRYGTQTPKSKQLFQVKVFVGEDFSCIVRKYLVFFSPYQ